MKWSREDLVFLPWSPHGARLLEPTWDRHVSAKFSLYFNGHFPGGPRLASTRMSSFCILLELCMMEVVMTTGAIRRAKLHSDCHHQQTNVLLLTGWMPFPSPNQQCQSTEGRKYHIPETYSTHPYG